MAKRRIISQPIASNFDKSVSFNKLPLNDVPSGLPVAGERVQSLNGVPVRIHGRMTDEKKPTDVPSTSFDLVDMDMFLQDLDDIDIPVDKFVDQRTKELPDLGGYILEASNSNEAMDIDAGGSSGAAPPRWNYSSGPQNINLIDDMSFPLPPDTSPEQSVRSDLGIPTDAFETIDREDINWSHFNSYANR